MKTIAGIFSVLLLAMTPLSGCVQQEQEKPLDEVTVQLSWLHQSQFAGLYAADKRGFYAAEGLAVNLLPRPDPGHDTIAAVLEGTADFGLANGIALVTSRSRGLPVTAIAAIYRRYPLAFFTLADSGINQPHDFSGHTMRAPTPNGTAVFQAMMTWLGLDPDSVGRIETGFDLEPFFEGEVDIWPGYITDEALVARERGYQVNVILPGDYGVHAYGDTLFTTERIIQENPELVLRFLRATLRGWRWAIENQAEAVQLALEYDPTLDEAHETAVMDASAPLIHTGEDQIGWMRPEVWQGSHDLLLEQGLLEGPVDLDQVYTLEFLQTIYGEEP